MQAKRTTKVELVSKHSSRHFRRQGPKGTQNRKTMLRTRGRHEKNQTPGMVPNQKNQSNSSCVRRLTEKTMRIMIMNAAKTMTNRKNPLRITRRRRGRSCSKTRQRTRGGIKAGGRGSNWHETRSRGLRPREYLKTNDQDTKVPKTKK